MFKIVQRKIEEDERARERKKREKERHCLLSTHNFKLIKIVFKLSVLISLSTMSVQNLSLGFAHNQIKMRLVKI